METYKKELTPVRYNAAAIKALKFEVEANHGCFRTHWHDRVEFIRLHKGEMYVGYGKNITKLHAGDLMLIPPKTPHKGYTIDCDVDYDVLMFDVRSFYNDTEICKTYLPAIFDGRARFKSVMTDSETVDCYDNIIEKATNVSLEVSAEIYRLFYLLFEHNLLEFRDEISRDNTIMEIIKYMEENFGQELTTVSIADHFGYSSEHLCRKFKSATGLTPMNYLKIYRMEEAYKMLKNEGGSIMEIAERCGFDDSNYFTRCFKAHFGMPPTKFIPLQVKKRI